MKYQTMCQFCGTDEAMLDGLTVDQTTRRCNLCEPEWAAITGRFVDPRTITKHWRSGADSRIQSRKAAVWAAYEERTALDSAA